MTQHYYTPKPQSKYEEHQYTITIKEHKLTFTTASGTFSIKKLDTGSQLLIEESKIPAKATILDLGCGYGPIGITLKKLHPDTEITLTDINERATTLAKKNAKNNNTEVTILTGDSYENTQKYDVILLNPPHTAGKELCLKLIEQAKEHLNKNGTLQIVARQNKGGKPLSEHMKKTFGNVETIARQSGYKIYLSKLLSNH